VSALAVRDDELSHARQWACVVLSCRGVSVGAPASQLRVSKRALVIAGATCAKEPYNFIFCCYIYVLLVKTNPMVYNMLYKLCS